MKKYILLLITVLVIFLPRNVNGQIAGGVPAKIWTNPAITALDEEVVWYFDLTGTSFVDGADLYLWAWSPSEPDANNWAKSSAFAKLEYVGKMVWKKTITPTIYFNRSITDIKSSAGFWMRLKDLAGTIQSDVINVNGSWTDLDAFAGASKSAQIFPANFSLNQPLSILINAKEVWTGAVKGGLVGSPSIHLHSGLNKFQEGTIVEANMGNPILFEKTKFKNMGNDIYKIDMIPSQYYGVANDFVMEGISFVVPSKDWVKVGTDAGGKDFLFRAPGVPIPPDPELYIFPKKFSQKDIFIIKRLFNESNVSKLTYTIKAGDKTLTGDFKGVKADMRAYIDLLTGLAGSPSLDKIHIVVKDNNNREILNTDISLVQLSELE